MWTKEESLALMRAVRAEGAGNWQNVLLYDEADQNLLADRTAADCKDRYRYIEHLAEFNEE